MNQRIEQILRTALSECSDEELRATLAAWGGVAALHSAITYDHLGEDVGSAQDLRLVISFILRERASVATL